MFKIKVYKYHTHLTIIAVALIVICFITLASFTRINGINQPDTNNTTKTLVKAASTATTTTTTTDQFPSVKVDEDNHVVSLDLPEELPFQEFESENNLSCEFNHGILHVWYKDHKEKDRSDYQIKLCVSCIKIYDGTRLVGTLSYDKSSLGRMLVNDNQ